MYVVFLLAIHGIEVKEWHMFDDAAEAFKKFSELDRQISQTPLECYSPKDLVDGRRLVVPAGIGGILHAFRTPL